jgi:predicted nucleic-acid-binding protein
MIGLDTNILIRYITQDDKLQSKKASTFIEENCTEDNPGYINQIVLCEINWVLKHAYRYEKELIISVLDRLLQTRELIVENSENARSALGFYKTGKADFSDYLIATLNHESGCADTATFDKKAGEFKLFILLE